jgi:cytoskeletal protein CcmA (bactofilin family)
VDEANQIGNANVIGNVGDAIIRQDTVIKGAIRHGGRIEVFGYVEGEIDAQLLVVHEGGRVYGRAKVENAQVQGTLQGDMVIRQLISIGSSGEVVGNVRYGAITMEPGANLTAELRNVPPELAGDFHLLVGRGRSVVVTPMDLAALDPDDAAHALTFRVSNARNGWVAYDGRLKEPVERFTQADLSNGLIRFVHDGNGADSASFDVVVSDLAGADSGAPQTVSVTIRH